MKDLITAEKIYLREYQTRVIDLTSSELDILIRHFSKYLYVERDLYTEYFKITAKQYVGMINIGQRQIVIQPKVPLTNLFYMLTYAYKLPQFRQELTQLVTGDEIFEFIIRLFLQHVKHLIRSGLLRGYVEREENKPFLRGRLMLAQHVQQNAVHLHRVYQRRNEFTADILENQILYHTLHLLTRLQFINIDLKHQLRRVMSNFVMIDPRHIEPSQCDDVIYTRLNDAYRTPIRLAQLLMQNLSLEGQAGATSFSSFLLDMNKLFEAFIEGLFYERIGALDQGWRLSGQASISIDIDGYERGKPDLLLKQSGVPIMVLDTKYKAFSGQPSPSDRNQMLAYCHALGIQKAYLLYGSQFDGLYERYFNGSITLRAVALNLDGDLSTFKERCHLFLSQILPFGAL